MATKIHHSFKFAAGGIIYSLRDNNNLRIHFIIAFAVLLLSFFFGLTIVERIIIATMVVLVITAEMINTSIEEMTNLITREDRVEAKIAKDVAAGMVLLVSVFAAIVGAVIFLPYIF